MLVISLFLLLSLDRHGLIANDINHNLKGSGYYYTVRGTSLAPLIHDGDKVFVSQSHTDRFFSTDDVVICNFKGNVDLLIKIIKAIPGDRWQLVEKPENDTVAISVNGSLLRNSEGAYYQIPRPKARLLQLYADEYATIPKDTYLLLGDRPEGSLDSTRFGLVHRSQIIGKVSVVEQCIHKDENSR